mmetsp:Transcript_4603/g.12942  ORF Transcript_4603/g.12942 Transcript_4603/m.12942 type:complete len:449 (+) Transcript_4603:81-1427(+)
MAPWAKKDATRSNRWNKPPTPSTSAADSASELSSDESVPPPPVPEVARQRAAACPSFILQHYHATGCAGGAFSWRAAAMDPEKSMFICTGPRDYRETTAQDIQFSKDDKRRGGGPRVGPFQESIPGDAWHSLPKYDYTTANRSCAFNERMHVEWENHVDHILANGGELPTASVVAKAGFRSCAPCCRDMLALARPTGKTFIMVDLAEDDRRGTFHFATGDKYLPVPKEACSMDEVARLKEIVLGAQDGAYASSQDIHDAVAGLGVPVDEAAQSVYLGDKALLPPGCAAHLRGNALLEVLHAEHFARLPAEYGASILRDLARPPKQREAVQECRDRARQMLIAAWESHVTGVDLEGYAAAAVAPLLPEEPSRYEQLRRSSRARPPAARLTAERLQAIDEDAEASAAAVSMLPPAPTKKGDDGASVAGASTDVPDDAASSALDVEDPEDF